MGAFLFGLGVTAAILFGRDRVFYSTARVFIRLGREAAPDPAMAVSGQVLTMSDVQQREIRSVLDLLKSNALIEGVVDSIGVEQVLNYTDEFTEKNAPSPIMAALKAQIPVVKQLLASVRLADPENRRAKAIESLEKQIKATAEEDSNIVSVAVRSESPKLSQKIGDEILEKFQVLFRDAHRAPGAYKFFVDQLAVVKSQLDSAMTQLRDAKNASGYTSILDQKSVLTERVKGINHAITLALSDAKGSNAKVVSMEMTLASVPERVMTSEVNGLTNTSRDEMRGRLYSLEVEYAELLSKFTSENPLVMRKKQQLDEAKQLYGVEQVSPQKTTTVNTTHEAVRVQHLIAMADGAGASARVTEFRQQLMQATSEIRELNKRELEMNTLEREIDVLDKKYRRYAESLEQARIDEALERNNFSSINVIQPPNFNDDPTDISNTLVAVVGLIGAMFLAVGAAFSKRYLKNDLESVDDVERELNLPVLSTIPSSRQKRIQFHSSI